MASLFGNTEGQPARSFVVPVRQRPDYEIKATLDSARAKFEAYAAAKLGYGTEQNPDVSRLAIVDILPQTDLNASVGAVANREVWENLVIAAPNVWTAMINQALANTRLVCFWGIACETPIPSITAVRFLLAQGITLATFQLQALWSEQVSAGMFSQFLVYDPNDVVRVEVIARPAAGVVAGAERYPLLGWTAEPRGQRAN